MKNHDDDENDNNNNDIENRVDTYGGHYRATVSSLPDKLFDARKQTIKRNLCTPKDQITRKIHRKPQAF
jgi:hypothetical protein